MKQQIRHITFNEQLHKYTDEYNNVYNSVTQQIGEYEEKFDVDYWSKKKAADLGLTQQQILDSWANTTKIACDKGNVIHKRLEDSINDSSLKIKVPNAVYNHNPAELVGEEISIEKLRETLMALYPKILKLLEFYFEKGYKAYAEKRVYLAEYLIAGTIDLVLIKGKDFLIVDWKTNKDELKFVSGYYKKINGIKTNTWVDKKEYFKYPLQNIMKCKGNVYALQLSSYAWMLECWGFNCKGLILCHIKESIDRLHIIEEKEVKIVKIPYLLNEVVRMFNHRKDKGNNIEMRFKSRFSW